MVLSAEDSFRQIAQKVLSRIPEFCTFKGLFPFLVAIIVRKEETL